MKKAITPTMLHGIKVIEFSGLAPGPFCGKILADYGADVVKIDKPNSMTTNWLDANKKSLFLNLKKSSAVDIVKRISSTYDVLIDPYRPAVLEKLGLGPSDLMKLNPRLIYARLSGFGQSGPLAKAAGHDINYLSLSGILSMLGQKDSTPTPPINLLADFAGGGLLCAFGIVLALYNRIHSGRGQVVDLSMSEGAAYVGSFLYSSRNSFLWGKPRGENMLDGGAHFYNTYKTKDDRYMAVGAIEPQFYSQLLQGLGLSADDVDHMDNFEENKKILADRFKEKTQQEWCRVFESLEACVTPVLSLDEAPQNPHNVARQNFQRCGGRWEPRPAPRLQEADGTACPFLEERWGHDPPCPSPGEHSVELLKDLGFSEREIERLFAEEAILGEQTTRSKL